MKSIMNWLRVSIHDYCALANEAVECGMVTEFYRAA